VKLAFVKRGQTWPNNWNPLNIKQIFINLIPGKDYWTSTNWAESNAKAGSFAWWIYTL